MEGQTGIKLFSDMTIRKQLISWFDKRLIMSACNEEQGYKPRDAKKYLRNLLLPGRKTQNEFNDLVRRGIERAKRKLLMNQQEEQTSGPSEYETVVNGVRYARCKESVPMSAPPQLYVLRRWSCIRNKNRFYGKRGCVCISRCFAALRYSTLLMPACIACH